LHSIARLHACAIAFENLNPLLRLPVSLDLASIEQKLVVDRRGGYCFEQNRLLAEALTEIGFKVTALAARVLWNSPDDAITSRSHMLLKVDTDDGVQIADVGFGGLTLTGAIDLQADIAQPTPHEPFRLVQDNGDWRMQALVQDEWKTLYRFDLQPQHPIDYEAPNYFLSTHPTSHFVNNLIAARALPDRRLALLNRQFTVHRLGGPSERRELAASAEIRDVLVREFLIALPEHPDLDRRLDELP